jgi:putative heme-binding domain-containing protein
MDLELLRAIRSSGYRGPLGILGHTEDDAEERLRDNLDGLDWLLPALEGKPAGPRPTPRTPVPPRPPPKSASAAGRPSPPAGGEAEGEAGGDDGYDPLAAGRLLAEARASGDAVRGALVFASAQFACLSCHRVQGSGGIIGPDLSTIGTCQPPEEIVESLLWPRRRVKPEYAAVSLYLRDGRLLQGIPEKETADGLSLREASTGQPVEIRKADVEERQEVGSLMPEGIASALSPAERRDLVRFLLDLGRAGSPAFELHPGHAPASFACPKDPLRAYDWPNRSRPVNRDRLYDFYAREADHFRAMTAPPILLPEFPGLDGGAFGHWGNQNEDSWADGRWNETDLGTVLAGVFRAPGVTVPKGVCLRLGERGEISACFNPETLSYEAVWSGGFVKFSPVRHGFMDGLRMDGSPEPRPEGGKPDRPFRYRGFYRHGRRVLFAYRIGEVDYLDAPWAEGGRFTRIVAPADSHPLAHLARGGPAQWPERMTTRGSLGSGSPYAVDTIVPPFDNPWKALLFFGDHGFLPDGSGLLSTMQGDVWRVEGLGGGLERVTWRWVASGLHHALGLVVADGAVHVLGRDQITRFHDLNGDGEYDFYECVTNTYATSPAGHDFICGLARDAAGRFYTVSGKDGLLRLTADRPGAEVLATGFRNPDGLCLLPDGSVTVPSSEGEWTPASMVCLVRPDREGGGPPPHFGYGGPRGGRPPDLPLVYLPRGLDNSSGGQAVVEGGRWGPLEGLTLHFSYGAAAHFLLLRDEGEGAPQGAVVPLPGDFLAGVHRGKFRPQDGQLYVSGMAGWGTYGAEDGCFQRVRYNGAPVQLPVGFRLHRNGVLVRFASPLDARLAGDARRHFVQAWNYHYAASYGSPEFSPRHPGTPGHDPLPIAGSHPLPDGKSLFLEVPDLQPVSQLYLRLAVDDCRPQDLFATVHRLGPDFTGYPGYRPLPKTIAAHPILSDLASGKPAAENPFRKPIGNARKIQIAAGANLTYSPRVLSARAGEAIRLVFHNPDVVPHNWVLVRPGTLAVVGDLANKIIADPEALARQYVPRSEAVIAYTDLVPPGGEFSIYLQTPERPGRYPFLCTFPGHWMVMNGQLVVEK